MKTVITDAGRSKSHPEEHNDCVVRALAVAFSIPYPEAHSLVRGMGREDGRNAMMPNLELGLSSQVALDEWREGCSVGLFARFHKRGTYLVAVWDGWSIAGHMICVKNGEAYDIEEVDPRLNVWLAWKVL